MKKAILATYVNGAPIHKIVEVENEWAEGQESNFIVLGSNQQLWEVHGEDFISVTFDPTFHGHTPIVVTGIISRYEATRDFIRAHRVRNEQLRHYTDGDVYRETLL